MEQELYELPEGWEWKPLAELCKFENGDRGKNYPSRALFVNEGIPVINAGNLNGKTIDLHNLNFISEDKYNLISNGKVRKNDLLFCLRGSLGKCALVTNLDKGVIASSLVIVRPLERILNSYLLYYFNSSICHKFIRQYNNGAAQPNLSAHCLSKFLIPFSSLPEQQRIAHKLDAVLGRIDKAISLSRENLESLNTLFASLLQHAFDPLGKAENENLYELPEGWEWKPLAELCKFENGDRGKNYPSRALFVNEGIPVINAGNLNGKTIDLHNLNFISEDKYNLISNGKVRKNDLLFCLRGSLGKCALVTNLDKGVIASSLVIVRPLERILNSYLLYYFNSSICHKFIRQYNNGAAQPNLSAHCLSKFLIPFSSLPEQQRIVHKLDVLSENIETQKKTLQKKIDELNNLKNSILDAAFRGQL